ncbi:MAG: hypothetical protein ACLPVJ_15740 [Syntrophobacteraceae bacterium]
MESTSKKGSSHIGLKRFGVCMLTVLVVIVYASAVATFNIPFYLPTGIIICSLYSWIIATKLPGIYPMLSRAIGQLLLTFLTIGVSTGIEAHRIRKLIQSGHYKYIYGGTDAIICARIAGMMVLFLFLFYLVIKYKKSHSLTFDK